MSNNKATNPNGNKDLSCLRCRKKKAKCSKTRPTCARCERSNHPCEYPDAPPNLTDLSKKVLDLYDSLRDLEGELLFKYMQPAADQNGLNNKNLLDRGDPIALMEINSTSSPMHQHRQPSSPGITNQDHSTATTTKDPPAPAEDQDIDWSMSYLSDGISIQTSTHTIAEFTRFIDKLTQQLFRDFGTDGAFSTYWDLDITQGSLMIDNNDTDEDDDLDEDDYLVTVPIFDTNLFLSAPPSAPPSTPPENHQHALSSTLPTLLPKLLQYVHTQLKYIDDTNFDSSLHRHVSPLLHQLITFLPAQDDDSLQQDPLTTLCIMTVYLTCTTFFSGMDTDITDPIIGQNCTPQESYMYAKAILIDTALQVTPTHGTCVSALLLLLVQVHSAFDDCGYVLLDLTWRMMGSGLVWHQGTAMTPETETIAAALIYLDTYITIFTSQHHSSHLGHDIGSALRQRMALSISKTQQQQSMLLESQLMWFLSQVLGLFYTRNSIDLETATVKVRKVDVDEVLTLVRDLEQWEQQLPSWAMCDTDASLPQSTNNSMMIQLHLTLHIIKILLFRPFCTAFNQQGTEQTYTKTTFLDLSMHSASRLATCVAQMKHDGGKAMKKDDDGWLLMAYRLIRDVVGRVRTTFDDDQDIKLQLDAIIHRIDS